jgi:hypothetical protein
VSTRAGTLTKRPENETEFLSTIITGSETQKASKSTVGGKDILSVSKTYEIRSFTREEYVHCFPIFSRNSALFICSARTNCQTNMIIH